MKLRLITLFFVVGLISVCEAQSDKTDYSLIINFSPAFIEPGSSKLTINVKSYSSNINLTCRSNSVKIEFVNNANITSLTNLLKGYDFRIIDTAGAANPKSLTFMDVKSGLDGIYVGIEMRQQNTIKKELFWSPDKGTENDKLSQILLNLMTASFKDEKTVKYIKQLKRYFPHE